MRRLGQVGAVALFAVGIALTGYGLITPAKAWLSVKLLDRAWERVLAGENEVRPWPWMDSEPVARLSYSKTQAATVRGVPSFVVMRGVSGPILAFAPGWHEQTTPPGEHGTILISAHRDTHFSFLQDIEEDDRLLLEDRRGHEQAYRVSEMMVTAEPTLHLQSANREPRLLLVTCYPLDAWRPDSRQRLVVVAEPI